MQTEHTVISSPDASGEASLLPVPAMLAPQARRAAAELAREGESGNTVASYRSAMRYWEGWFALRYGTPLNLPLPPAVVVQFVVDHALRSTPAGLACEMPPSLDAELVARGLKSRPGAPALTTLLHRISVLSKAHGARELPNPCADAAVRELLARTRRAYARRAAPTGKKDALTRELLLQVLATCDTSLRGLRDRALLLFAWSSGGRRRSEVVRASMDNVRRIAPGEFVYTLRWSKTNQGGDARAAEEKPVIGAAGQALEDWLAAAGIREGAIFRRIRRGGHVGEPLSDGAVRRIVQERCAQAGLEGDFSAHSLRSGFVTEAARQQVPLAETMALTGHASVATVVGYFRAAEAWRSRAADLLGGDGDGDAAGGAGERGAE